MMFKFPCLIVFLVCFVCSSFQSVHANEGFDQEINSIFYLKNAEYTIDDLSSQLFTPYTKEANALFRFPFETSSSYWVKFPVSNTQNKEVTRYLRFSYPDVENVTFYLQLDNSEQKATQLDPLSRSSRIFSTEVTLKSGDTGWLLLKIDSRLAPIVFNLHLMSPTDFYQKETYTVAFHSLFLGAMVFAALYFLASLIMVKKYVYLLYITHILAFVAFQAFIQGYPKEFFPNLPYSEEIKVITALIASCSFTFFALHFLNESLSRRYKLAIYTTMTGVTISMFFYIAGFVPPDALAGFGLLGYILVLVSAIMAYRRGNQYASSIFISSAIVVTGAFFHAFAIIFQVIPLHEYTLYSMSFSNTLEVFVILVMFVFYFKSTYEQKERAFAEKLSLESSFTRRLEQEVKAKTAELDKARNDAERLARTDELTKLYNRRAFTEQAAHSIKKARESRQPLSLVMFDIDHFKRLNDSYGHDAGDKVLQKLAEHIQASIRGTDIAARMGGEEFTILLPDTSTEQALSIAEQLNESIGELKVHFNNLVLSITASFGVSEFLPNQDSFESLFSRTDKALYRAKHLGRNRVEGQIES